MPYPTRAYCDVCDDPEALFVWDATERLWRCNWCGAAKLRDPLVKMTIGGERVPITVRKQRARTR